MNDFHIALLWLIALELITGIGDGWKRVPDDGPSGDGLAELFCRFRSPWKA